MLFLQQIKYPILINSDFSTPTCTLIIYSHTSSGLEVGNHREVALCFHTLNLLLCWFVITQRFHSVLLMFLLINCQGDERILQKPLAYMRPGSGFWIYNNPRIQTGLVLWNMYGFVVALPALCLTFLIKASLFTTVMFQANLVAVRLSCHLLC